MKKLWGAALILAAGLYLLLTEQRRNARDMAVLTDWIALLSRMQGEIRWKNVPLGELLESDERTRPVKDRMKSNITLQDAWNAEMESIPDKLLGKVLREVDLTGDKQQLLSGMDYALRQLRALREDRRVQSGQRQRIRCAAVLTGTGLFIILLI